MSSGLAAPRHPPSPSQGTGMLRRSAPTPPAQHLPGAGGAGWVPAAGTHGDPQRPGKPSHLPTLAPKSSFPPSSSAAASSPRVRSRSQPAAVVFWGGGGGWCRRNKEQIKGTRVPLHLLLALLVHRVRCCSAPGSPSPRHFGCPPPHPGTRMGRGRGWVAACSPHGPGVTSEAAAPGSAGTGAMWAIRKI